MAARASKKEAKDANNKANKAKGDGTRKKTKIFSRNRVRTLALSTGILRIGSKVPEYAINFARQRTRALIPELIALVGKRRIIKPRDIVTAIEGAGVFVAGFV